MQGRAQDGGGTGRALQAGPSPEAQDQKAHGQVGE